MPVDARFPISILVLGIVTVLVAGWGAAAPFAAPDFGFVADRFTAWQWSETSAFLALVPGAVAFVAGLWVLGAASRMRYGRRPDLWVLGFIVTVCGAWFVVGQYVWPVIDGGRLFIVPSAPYHFMWKEMCFAVGPGVILVLCGSVFMGWAIRRHVAVVADRYPRVVPPAAVPSRTVVERPVATTAGAAGTTGTMAAPATTAPPTTAPPTSTVREVPAGRAEAPVAPEGTVAETREVPPA